MGGFVDEAIESLKQTINLPLLLYFFLVYLLEAIVYLVAFVFFALVALLALFGSLANVDLTQLPQLFSNPATITSLIAVILLLYGALLLVLLFVQALFTGIRLNLFNNFLKSKDLDLGRAFEQAKPRAFTCFKINLLVIGAILLFVGFIMALVFVPLLALGAGKPTAAVAGVLIAILLVLLLMLAFFLALFFLSPFLFLFAPTAFFERHGAIDTIRRSIALVKPHYWGNLGFVLIYGLIMLGVSLLIQAILRVVSIFAFLPFMASGSANGAGIVAGIVGGVMIFAAVYILIAVPFAVWSEAFNAACIRNLYFLNLSRSSRPKEARKRKAK